jgi:hypothetical protein
VSSRRGVYLTELEAAKLDELVHGSNMTPSSVLRVGLRLLAGLPLGPDGRELAAASVELERGKVHLAVANR